MSDPLSWLPKTPTHLCGPTCREHSAGIVTDEGASRITSHAEGAAPQGPPEVPPTPEVCADCDESLDAHTSPILRDGVVVGLANPENSCKRYIPR